MLAASASTAAAACILQRHASAPLRRSSSASIYAPSSSPQQQLLLRRLAAEMEKQPPDDTRTFAPSVRALYDTLISVDTTDQVHSLLHGIDDQFPLPVFCSVIRKLGSSCRTAAALAVYEWLHSRCRYPSHHEQAAAVVPPPPPDIFIYCSVLGVIRRSARFDLLPELLRRMSDDGVSLDLVAYKILISCYYSMKLHPEAMAAFDELTSKGFLLHDAKIIEMLMEGCSNAADIDGALRVYCAGGAAVENGAAAAGKLRYAVSGIAYRCVRRMLAEGRSHSLIFNVVERVEGAIGRLAAGDYRAIIWACGEGAEDHRVLAQRLVARRTAMGYQISAAACNHAMNLLQSAGDCDAVMAIFEQMLAEGPLPDRDSYRIVTSSLHQALLQQPVDSRRCVRLLSEMAERGVAPEREALEAAMAACAGSGDGEGAAEVLGRMVEWGRMPSDAAYGSLLAALQKGRRAEEALRVWGHMKKVGVRPNAQAYAAMRALNESAEMVVAAVEETRPGGSNVV